MGDVKRISTCLIDVRADLNQRDLSSIKKQYQKRLFVNGFNSMDRQMQPAFSYKSPKGLFRFLTGHLFGTVKVEFAAGKVMVSVYYDNIILNKLEERYGFMFAWSKSDIEYIDKVVESRLIAQGLDPEINTDLISNRSLTLEDERLQIANDMNTAKLATDNIITPLAVPLPIEELDKNGVPIPPPKNRIAGTLKFDWTYDPSFNLNQNDLLDIQNHIRDRVLINYMNANDTIIKAADRVYLDDKTMNSIKVKKEKNGLLNLWVTFYTQEAMLFHTNQASVFGFSPSDIAYIDNIFNRKMGLYK